MPSPRGSTPGTRPGWGSERVASAAGLLRARGLGVARPAGLLALVLLAGAAALAGLALGPVRIGPGAIWAAATGAGDPAHAAILGQIRAPRVALGAGVGVGVALAGAALQGLLRNPLADPGLIGVTGGAALGAAVVLVLGDLLLAGIAPWLRPWLLPLVAFAGAGAVTAFVFLVARVEGGLPVATLILAGVAVNAIAGAGIGALVYVSDDDELRDLTFWSMGALGAAGWPLVLVARAAALLAGALLARLDRALDLFQLGERAAFHAGIEVERVKRRAGLLAALGVGAATAAAGPIGFVGLVAPHLARLLLGPAHAWVLPGSAALVLLADLAVRLAVPPAEPPIGLATSLIGGPFFLWLLLARARGSARGGRACLRRAP